MYKPWAVADFTAGPYSRALTWVGAKDKATLTELQVINQSTVVLVSR